MSSREFLLEALDRILNELPEPAYSVEELYALAKVIERDGKVRIGTREIVDTDHIDPEGRTHIPQICFKCDAEGESRSEITLHRQARKLSNPSSRDPGQSVDGLAW